MRSQPVEFLAFVEDDLRYAYGYYDSWVADGSIWKYRFFRRAVIRRSYFGIFFAIEPEVTTVVAVRDMRDDPKEIQRLLRERKKG